MNESNATTEGANSPSEETNTPSAAGKTNSTSEETRGAVQHLEDALAAGEMDEVNYHVRQALQLLDVERDGRS